MFRRSLIPLAILMLVAGCGYPQAAPENRELIAALRTACSARNSDWLQATVEKIEGRKAAGEMGDAEYAALQSIAATAQAGDWETAERESFRMQSHQRPTAEEIARIPAAARD
jgi:hypothetical protein